MVELPGSLERATLGDILGALHRDQVSGALCLEELGRNYQRHVIHWRDGLIHHVETARRPDPTGVSGAAARAFGADRWLAGGGLGEQRRERLEALFELTQAKISFRVMGSRPTPSQTPLEPAEFLHGRRRKRDAAYAPAPDPTPSDTPRQAALRSLGLQGNPGADAIRAAFRKLARHCHPDLYAREDEPTRAASCRRFIEISRAYAELTTRSA